MRILLDARDLIDLLEHGRPCLAEEFKEALEHGGHRLVLTPLLVFELAAPLLRSTARTNVMLLLRRLEEMPISYLAQPRIPPMEYRRAVEDFVAGHEFSGIDPYVDRFDRTFPPQGRSPTDNYLRHDLAETIWTLWTVSPDVFEWGPRHLAALRAQFAADRAIAAPPDLGAHFREKVRRDLMMYGIRVQGGDVSALADWIYEGPGRCPSVRLNYEMFHHLRRNMADIPDGSDFPDLAHAQCLPYVDAMTLDRRMADYVRRATRGWPGDLGGETWSDVDAVVALLSK